MSQTPEIDPIAAAAERPGAARREVYTISELNEAARGVLEQGLGRVWVEGEISNIARPASGHVYFSLKDRAAQIRCAMFRSRGGTLNFKPENGLSVLAHGRVSLYAPRGDYQLIVDTLEAAGDGLLRLRFEQLKRRLFEQGLFDEERKRPLPAWPRCIGVVTSASGAAVRDIVTVLRRRCPSIPVIVYPCAVQGEQAAGEIVAAIETANRRAECDVLIVGRGGGSLEDLWSFNEERVARAIVASAIPLVSAVGHEIDITIADLVADLRAATPSAAAELVSPDAAAAGRRVSMLAQRLHTHARHAINSRVRELRQLRQRLISPQRRLESNFQRVDELTQRLAQSTRLQLRLKGGQVQALAARLSARSPLAMLNLMRRDLHHHRARLNDAVRRQLTRHSQALARFEGVLRAVGPVATLERGYAIVTDQAGRVIRRSSELRPGDSIDTRLASGRIRSEVTASLDEERSEDDG